MVSGGLEAEVVGSGKQRVGTTERRDVSSPDPAGGELPSLTSQGMGPSHSAEEERGQRSPWLSYTPGCCPPDLVPPGRKLPDVQAVPIPCLEVVCRPTNDAKVLSLRPQ